VSLNFDVIVIGAGIVGAACARECAAAGMHVALIERNAIACGATGAAMGHVVLMDDSPAQFALTQYSQSLWAHLREQLPADVEYQGCGTIWVARDEAELAIARAKQSAYTAHGLAAETLTREALLNLEPALSSELAGGLLVPGDIVVSPPNAARFLVSQAQDSQADVFLGRQAMQAGAGEVTLDGAITLHAPRIVIATGTDAARLLPGLPIRKRKGHLLITHPHPGFIRHQLVEFGYLQSAHGVEQDSVAFNLQPRRNGQLLLGSSRQFDIDNDTVDPAILQRMIDRAMLFVPAIAAKTPARSWTGVRAATPDKLPLIGPVGTDPTVFLATGHEGLGITTSLGTARLLADRFLDRTPAIAPEPYLPVRFQTQTAH
jgi:D-hydroxyproline dehydrogenase subunit beta